MLEPRWLLSLTDSNLADPTKNLTIPADVSDAMAAPSETSGSDDDPNGATVLPMAPAVDVQGTLDMGAASTLLKLPVAPHPSVIELRLTSALPNQPIAESLRVFDPSMHELARSTPGADTQSLYIRLMSTSTTESALYARISLLDSVKVANDPTTPSFSYVLEVMRTPLVSPTGPSTSSGDSLATGAVAIDMSDSSDWWSSRGSGAPPIVLSLPSPSSTPGTTLSPPVSAPAPPPPTTVPTGPLPGPEPNMRPPAGSGHPTQGATPTAVGMLPLRSAAAIGGVLTVADPVPPVDPREAVQADFALFDPARDLGAGERLARRVVPVALRPADADAEVVTALRGPGGLPLLATALVAGPMGSRTRNAAVVKAQKAQEAPEPATALAPLAACSSAGTSASTLASASTAKSERSGRSVRTRRTSVLPGVVVAFALGSGLLLPDLAAALQIAPTPRIRLRLGPIRRALRRSLART